MFWKSLDHQVHMPRNADKRQFQTKTLQQEIAVKWEEQQRARQVPYNAVPGYQLEFLSNDVEVILDACYLLLSYTEYHQTDHYARLVIFVKELIPLFFGLDQARFQQSINSRLNGSPAEEEADEDSPASDDTYARSRKVNGKKDDLRRGVLERGRSGRPARRDKEDSIAASSRGSTPEGASGIDDDVAAPSVPELKTEPEEDSAPEKWVKHPVHDNVLHMQVIKPEEPYRRDVYHLYANLPIFCFFRMFFTLYERLKKLKDTEQEVHKIVARAMGHKPAIELHMIDKLPTDFFYDVSSTTNYYSQMLRMMDQVMSNEMDMSHVEETLRRYYLHCGYLLYPLDKLMSALARFAIAIFSNEGKDKSTEIVSLFRKDRAREVTTHQDELNYRRQVEKYCKEGEIYRFNFVSFRPFLSPTLFLPLKCRLCEPFTCSHATCDRTFTNRFAPPSSISKSCAPKFKSSRKTIRPSISM
jgi:paired amphipathic helix protein Sin3a